ncbi:Probable enoyl-CoA hydratase echA8 [uncultured Clostridium sp.]|uniref:enoyl-CoA hydratase/isomerase family protein n=1 Tax=Intestinimonas butyriciproducens TaxID=1297617 RepID=UPI0008233F34|nr:enoyl-CoA hydratase-related protein [Intestinimonas butyriciproducens]MDB7861604.1 enoyl-CoA hydratase-related protein [Intestinimonas butyriciproducens]MDB7864173.1 enoyl-CoA hydratase-related protein [Intestinimonas butyriciproducens]OLR68703.1 enoyl-CoA hydratase [Intestinimonas butyriciproducens]SCJ80261.1 Probable enoyl-CoA hydratase echA8 [uncultured Clostridium sp.]
MAYQNIKIEINDGIAVLTLNRPEVRNALDYVTWDEIRAGMRELRFNDDAHVIILTGAGGKAFASGADIKALNARTVSEQMNSEVNDILYEITMHKKPVIAAVDGYALGGGCELAMACDIRIATKKSKFGQPEVNLGIIPGGGGTQRLQRLVGIGKAKELIFTGDIISAEEAERIGLIEKVVEDGAVLEAAIEMAKKIKAKGPVAITLAKQAINVGANTDLYSGLCFERYSQAIAFSTADKAEGTLAFIEKRPAQFKGV